MIVSRFVTDIRINDKEKILYNTATKKYFKYSNEQKTTIYELLANINKGEYTEEELQIIGELVSKKILVSDKIDEIRELQNKENDIRYQENVFYITIIVTSACNFRCSYCIQEHENTILSDVSEKKIINLLEHMATQVRKISISWFGGEPLLQVDTIERINKSLKESLAARCCELENQITTNGFLLNDVVIQKIEKLNMSNIQITIDGDKKSHDERRFAINGDGTYEIILKNMIEVLRRDISVVLRINIDKSNYKSAEKILYKIPKDLRSLVTVSVANLYQEKDKISTFYIYKRALELGYNYPGRWNSYVACHACFKNSIVVNTDGKVVICANALSEGNLAEIDADGKIHVKDREKYNCLKTVSAFQNSKCKECILLPMCIGTCKYYRMKKNDECLGKSVSGMSIEEIAKLDILYDKKQEERRKYE